MERQDTESRFVERVGHFAKTAAGPVFGDPVPSPEALASLRMEAAREGLTGIQVPVGSGGLGYSFSCKSQCCEILARADFGFAMSVVNTQNVAQKLAATASEELKQRYIPALLSGERTACTAITEPTTGSDAAAMRTTARRDGSGWTLDGEKSWIINAEHAETIIVYAQTGEISDGRGVAAFLVDTDRPGIERTKDVGLAGQDAIAAGGFRLSGYRASTEEMLAPAGTAFRSILQEINGARIYVAAMCNGMVDTALARTIEYGKSRETFGKPLAGHQGWRWPLARASAALEASRHLVSKAEAEVDAGADTQLIAAQAKIVATDMAAREIPALMQAMGAAGLDSREPFSRYLMATRIATLADGSTEMLLDRVAHLITKDPV